MGGPLFRGVYAVERIGYGHLVYAVGGEDGRPDEALQVRSRHRHAEREREREREVGRERE